MIRNLLQRLQYTLQQWMVGRYGYDRLSKTLSVVALVFLLLSVFIPILYVIALVLMIISVFRTYSRNIPKRQAEYERYCRFVGKIRTKIRLHKRMWTERKTHCYFKCKTCRAVIRVPKGRGDIDVGCPRCKTRTKRRT